ncbi:MAG: tetratricopeptide repeat protein [Paludibacteraceae bacterium]|nr:tetratricopeptide repeat protein [Paludibacteraceae bacterium]
MRNKLLFIFSLVLIHYASAQPAAEAERLFFEKQYAQSAELYNKLLKQNPQYQLYNYRYARCLYELGQTDQAIDYFLKSGNRYPLTNFYLGECYFRAYQFELSQDAFTSYLSRIDSTSPNWAIVNRRIQQNTLGKRLINRVLDAEIIDTMIVGKQGFLSALHFSPTSGRIVDSEASIDYINSKGDRKISVMQNDTTESLSFYSSQKLIDGWTLPVHYFSYQNSDINFPFLLNDGVTLYFASDIQTGMGGYDIFKTRMNPESQTFLKPENLGFPFNSPYNDYLLAIDEDRQIAWLVSDRYCADDSVCIYVFDWNETKKYLQQSQDSNSRSFAQLKQFTKSEREITLSDRMPDNIVQEQEQHQNSDFVFIVADGVVYTRLDNFKNQEAKKKFVTYKNEQEQFETQQNKLQNMRKEYATVSVANKSVLAVKIQALEQTLLEQETTLNQKANIIRQLEQQKL